MKAYARSDAGARPEAGKAAIFECLAKHDRKVRTWGRHCKQMRYGDSAEFNPIQWLLDFVANGKRDNRVLAIVGKII